MIKPALLGVGVALSLFSFGCELEEGCDYGATAVCADGTYSYSSSRSGTCSWHGGVAYWCGYEYYPGTTDTNDPWDYTPVNNQTNQIFIGPEDCPRDTYWSEHLACCYSYDTLGCR